MSITKWRPFRELETMRREMDRLFDEFITPMRRRRWLERPEEAAISPNVDMYDAKNEIVVKAEIPGVEKENIDLKITENNLTLKGEIKKEEEVKKEDCYACERSYVSFFRTIPLPAEADSPKAKATFKNGVLEITLPKKEGAKRREIKVKVS